MGAKTTPRYMTRFPCHLPLRQRMNRATERTIQSIYIAYQTLLRPKWNICANTLLMPTRNSHMDSMETVMV